MAFWSRVKVSQIGILSNRLKRCYFQMHNPSELQHSASWHTTFRVLNKPSLTTHTNRVEFLYGVRFFAAPVQPKPKKEEKDAGPKLNEKVTHAFVRLVLDEGHVIVSRNEALSRAKSLNLDLVEVDRNAEPPVCKLMDYHKEKYVRQVTEKERAKKKSDLTLKRGGCKEVRFLGKTELKDLNIKADTIKRMMDKGYRVKCMAQGNGSENENLGEVLSRLYSLIEDVAFVESGPHVEKKQAYIVVRHIKFGPTKKGSGKKAAKVNASSSVHSQGQERDYDAADVRLEHKDDVITEDLFEVPIIASSSTPFQGKTYRESGNSAPDSYTRQPAKVASFQVSAEKENRYRREPPPAGENRYRRENTTPSSVSQRAPPGGENRYRKEPSNAASFQAPPPAAGENRYRRETTNPSFSHRAPPGGENRYRKEQPQFNMNSSPPHIKSSDYQFLNKFPEQHSSQSGTHRSPSASGYGNFGAPQAEKAPGNESAAASFNRYKKENVVNSARYSSTNH